jgi:hypothetical protein
MNEIIPDSLGKGLRDLIAPRHFGTNDGFKHEFAALFGQCEVTKGWAIYCDSLHPLI